MTNLDAYIASHLQSKEYRSRVENAGAVSYENALSWRDFVLSGHMIYSHRVTDYTRGNFRDHFHTHDFWELVIYISGDVCYLTDDGALTPEPCDVILSPPGLRHTATLVKASRYERYVFYFTGNAFGSYSDAMLAFSDSAPFLRLPREPQDALRSILAETDAAVGSDASTAAILAYSHIIRLFCLVGGTFKAASVGTLPERAAVVKRYIDAHFTEPLSVTELAKQFYYSREYLSRIYKRHFNVSIKEYILDRRLELARSMLRSCSNVMDVCSACGFGSTSFFIEKFRQRIGITPYQYAKLAKGQQHGN
ncbi:MAG: helix-turn-helix transcriptional regulator [Clostridia bacterium]|nr:helix-turn-helix transcriptional regulator [Clostridia bacterium]